MFALAACSNAVNKREVLEVKPTLRQLESFLLKLNPVLFDSGLEKGKHKPELAKTAGCRCQKPTP